MGACKILFEQMENFRKITMWLYRLGTIEFDHLTNLMKIKVGAFQQTFFGTICIIMVARINNLTQKARLAKTVSNYLSTLCRQNHIISYLYQFMSKIIFSLKQSIFHLPSSSFLTFSISKGKLSNETCIASDSQLIE